MQVKRMQLNFRDASKSTNLQMWPFAGVFPATAARTWDAASGVSINVCFLNLVKLHVVQSIAVATGPDPVTEGKLRGDLEPELLWQEGVYSGLGPNIFSPHTVELHLLPQKSIRIARCKWES